VEYTVVFDVTQSGFRNLWFPAFGLIFVAVGSGLVVFRRHLSARTPRFFPFAFLGFAIFWTIATFAGTAGGYSSLASALREGRCEVVTGEVTQFHPMPATGHDTERFVVSGRHFKYSDYIVSPGFNNTSSHGGPIREGLSVRIHHVGNDIARLEVANDLPP
jgi:hypothetical protein